MMNLSATRSCLCDFNHIIQIQVVISKDSWFEVAVNTVVPKFVWIQYLVYSNIIQVKFKSKFRKATNLANFNTYMDVLFLKLMLFDGLIVISSGHYFLKMMIFGYILQPD